MIDIKTEYAGRWAGVLLSLGMSELYLRGRYGECPVCGDKGKNARWSTKKEYNVCSKCGITRPMDLALNMTGESFNETTKIIRGVRVETKPKHDETEKNRQRIKSIYAKRKPIKGTEAQKYLVSRNLLSDLFLPARDVFFVPDADYWTEKDGKWTKEILPAMVSVIRNLAGETVSYHMTYLSAKAASKEVACEKVARKILPPIKDLSGCAIQLFQPVNGVLAVAEGIETALAVHQLEGLPVWAAGSAWGLENLNVPENVKELWIYGDNDKNFAGQSAAYNLAMLAHLKIEKVFVEIPKVVGDDFLDVLQKN